MPNKKATRCRYSAEFKRQILAECAQTGASITAIAMTHGINPKVVHKWRCDARRSGTVADVAVPPAFILLPIAPALIEDTSPVIRIELRCGPAIAILS